MDISGTTTAAAIKVVGIHQELSIAATPAKVFEAFTGGMGSWWQRPGHTTDENSAVDLRLDAKTGGTWYEDWGNGDGHIWAHVVSVRKGRLIRLSIPEGALWSDPGIVEILFEAEDDGCRLKLTHKCLQQTENWNHEAYIPDWTSQVGERFKEYVESGAVSNIAEAVRQ